MAFLIDGSKSISDVNFKKIKNYVTAAISSYDIQPSNTHVAVSQFGEDTKTIVDFATGYKKEIIGLRLNDASKVGGKRNLKKALNYVEQTVFGTAMGARPNVKKNLIIVTQGEIDAYTDNGELATIVQTVKDQNIEIVVVGVNMDKDVIEKISGPDSLGSLVIDIDDLPESLGNVEDDVRGKGK